MMAQSVASQGEYLSQDPHNLCKKLGTPVNHPALWDRRRHRQTPEAPRIASLAYVIELQANKIPCLKQKELEGPHLRVPSDLHTCATHTHTPSTPECTHPSVVLSMWWQMSINLHTSEFLVSLTQAKGFFGFISRQGFSV